MYRLLHLSDLHFGGDHFFRQGDGDLDAPSLADAIGTVLEAYLTGTVDCLVLSGDFFSTDQPADRALAARGLEELVERLDPGLTVAVPGNHDVTWSGILHDDPLYFYNRLVEAADIPGRSRDLPHVLEIQHGTVKPIALLLMNSCHLESETLAGIGRLGERQLVQLEQLVRDRNITPQTHTAVGVLHHHLLPIAAVEGLPAGPQPREGERPELSHTVDAVEVLRRLSALGVHLVLHGHQHHRAVLRHENLVWGTQAVCVIAAGSCGAREVRRQFFLHEIDDEQVQVTSFAQHPENEALFEEDRELAPIRLAVP